MIVVVTSELPDQLRATANKLRSAATAGDDLEGVLLPLEEAASRVAAAWSGSNLGFHSRVYHASMTAPPPGEHFSSEWGFEGMFQGTTGDWREFRRGDVMDAINREAGSPDLSKAQEISDEARRVATNASAEISSILTAFLSSREDDLLRSLKKSAEDAFAITEDQAIRVQLPNGSLMSRDAVAVSQGLKPAPHQETLARVVSIRSPFAECIELADTADRAAAHIERLLLPSSATRRKQGSNVFIGHGQSRLWRELKDFVQDRMALPWDEFNRVPVAGVTNIARLSEMLDDATVAFLVLTAEDEQKDGEVLARQNVVHEAGLFQGRLGFTRAIVLLEDGCAEFSNIQGLGQIRFPSGNISASFEEVRRVLEREGLA